VRSYSSWCFGCSYDDSNHRLFGKTQHRRCMFQLTALLIHTYDACRACRAELHSARTFLLTNFTPGPLVSYKFWTLVAYKSVDLQHERLWGRFVGTQRLRFLSLVVRPPCLTNLSMPEGIGMSIFSITFELFILSFQHPRCCMIEVSYHRYFLSILVKRLETNKFGCLEAWMWLLAASHM